MEGSTTASEYCIMKKLKLDNHTQSYENQCYT